MRKRVTVIMSDCLLFVALLLLAALNYGWVVYPELGVVWNVINGIIVIGIVLMAVLYRLSKRLFFTSTLRDR
jgi:hypothetical protein